MKRLLVVGMIMMVGVFCSGNGFSATYDATGTWDYSTTGNWGTGNAGCTAHSDETGTLTLTQTGNSVTIVAHGITFTGDVSGASYSLSGSWAEDGEPRTMDINLTLSSGTSGSGIISWHSTDGSYSCNGGSDLHMTKRSYGGCNGYLVTSDLWIGAVINTEEKGPIEAVWQKGGEDITAAGDRVIWGHFYASPDDVTWGSQNNPDLFVKIWFDHNGRLDVNFFHVSVPDIDVYSDYAYDGTPDEQGTTTMSRRYIRQYYENGQSCSEENYEDGAPPSGYSPTGNPSGYSTINDLRIGSIINTVEKGPIDAVWHLGGQDTTSRGDQVVWGHFYASPNDVTWGSENNPDLFVKIWFDVSGRVDVNYFHVSVPDIEVYSDLPDEGTYDQQGTTILDNRYIRCEYFLAQYKTVTIDGSYDDWEDRDRIYIDTDGPDCGDAPGQDIKEVYVAQDDDFIYVRFVLNGPLDETFGYKFGEDLHIHVRQNNGVGDICYATPYNDFDIGYEIPNMNLPGSFVHVNSNQFECKFYKYDVRRWESEDLAAWCDQGSETVCRDYISLPKMSFDFSGCIP